MTDAQHLAECQHVVSGPERVLGLSPTGPHWPPEINTEWSSLGRGKGRHLTDQVQVHGSVLPDLGQAIWPLSLSGVFRGDHICIMGLLWLLSELVFVKRHR